MLRDRFRGVFSFARRRKPKADARPEDNTGVVPPIRLPKEPAGVTVHVHSLRVSRSRTAHARDIFDYLLGLLVIGLLVLGGTFWTSRNENSGESQSGWQSLSPPSWMRRGSTGGDAAPRPFSMPELHAPRSKIPKPESNIGEVVSIPDRPPLAIRIVPASYTDAALNAGFHGKVFVTVFVDALGVPEKIEATSRIPFGLERPIQQAILQWRFQPALSRGNVAVASKTVVEVPFR
jgi:Gram-negative bacterial TonB protein C-terminal